MDESKKVDPKRRGFLFAAGAGGAAVAGAVAVKTAPKAVIVSAEAKPATAGYRTSAHNQQYYDSARI